MADFRIQPIADALKSQRREAGNTGISHRLFPIKSAGLSHTIYTAATAPPVFLCIWTDLW